MYNYLIVVSPLDSCIGNQPFQCGKAELKIVHAAEITEPGEDATFIEEENLDEPEDIALLRNNSKILEQTSRMFKFAVGLEGQGNYIGMHISTLQRYMIDYIICNF